jgi:hypothetical protein
MLEISPQLLRQANLSVNDMAAYLTQHGWDKIPNQNQRLMIFHGVTDGFGDALRRLSEAVNLVAFLEDRSPESVLVELQNRRAIAINN